MDAEEQAFWRGQVTTRLDAIDSDMKEVKGTMNWIKWIMGVATGVGILFFALPAIFQTIGLIQ